MSVLLEHPESDAFFWGTEADLSKHPVNPVALDRLRAGTIIDNVGLSQSTVRPSMDFETYSEAGFTYIEATGKIKGVGAQGKGGLPVVGTGVYAEHPSTEVICLYYDLKDGKGRRGWWPGMPQPVDLLTHIANGGEIEAFNSTFEFFIWNFVCTRRYGWPPLAIEQCYCVMSMSRRWGLPGSLANAAKALGAADKDKEGKNLIQKLCRPHTPTKNRPAIRHTISTAWDDYQAMFKYCDQDVATEDDVKSRIPDLTPYERETWLTDQRINLRGVLVDSATLDAGLRLLQEVTAHYTAELKEITGDRVQSVGEVAKTLSWLSERGIAMAALDSDAVAEAIAELTNAGNGGTDPQALRVLEIRQALSSANVKKLAKLRHQLNSDSRLRNQYMYCGAERTGRWSSAAADDNASNSQLQNITAKGPKSRECEACGRIFGGHLTDCPKCGSFMCHDCDEWTVEAVEYAVEDIRTMTFEQVQHTWGNPIDLLCGCLRGLFVAKDGHDFICCDFSAVEAVALACLARCQWRIDVFKTHGKIYEMSASKITGVPFEEMMQYKKDTGMHHPTRKKIGKVAELACFGPRTQVLTYRGYVWISGITKDDYLWDGVEWVTSDGVIAKGERSVLALDGVLVTPEHPISLGGSWKEAKVLASNRSTLAQALAIGSENLPSCAMKSATSGAGVYAPAPVVPRGMSTSITFLAASLRVAVNAAAQKVERRMSNCTLSTRTFAPTPNTDGAWLTDFGLQSRGAIHQALKGTETTVAEESAFVMSGAAKMARAAFSSTSSLSAAGTPPPLRWTGVTPTDTTNPETSALSPKPQTVATKGVPWICNAGLTTSSDVYDIVNAGPRHRFTIKTDSGHLIVHNSGYGGWVGAWCAFGADNFMTEPEIKENVLAWRAESPEIVEFWGGQFRQTGPRLSDGHPEYFGLEGAAVQAVLHAGQQFWANDICFGVHNKVLYCRLPSGRLLAYHAPQLIETAGKWGKPSSYTLTFMGYNTNPKNGPRGWVRMETYGGRLAENCISEGTEVLTDSGWVKIEDVTQGHKVHDGVEFVGHGGTLFKSEQPCVTVDGVYMTSDHEVLTNDGWQTASQNPEPHRPDLREVDRIASGVDGRPQTQVDIYLSMREGVREKPARRAQECPQGSVNKLRLHDGSADSKKSHHSRHERSPLVRSVALDVRPLQVAHPSSVGELRGAGDQSLPRVGGGVHCLLSRHGAYVCEGATVGQGGQQSRVLPFKLPMGNGKVKLEQQEVKSAHPNKRRDDDGSTGVRGFGDRGHNAVVPFGGGMAFGKALHSARCDKPRRVFDILNAGPRERFVVRGEKGPFIVHNCTQGVCADIQAEALVRCEKAGYAAVMHTHDEVCAEVPEGFGSVEEMCDIMSQAPDWASWWPLKAAGWRHKRYQKD